MKIRDGLVEEAYLIAQLMAGFEKVTEYVRVDVDYTAKKYIRMMNAGTAKIFILETDEGKMIGGLGCIKAEDLHFPRLIAIETFWYVDPKYRGEGKKLVEHFETWAKEAGCAVTAMIHLSDSYPDTLKELYLKRGYKLIEQHYIKEI